MQKINLVLIVLGLVFLSFLIYQNSLQNYTCQDCNVIIIAFDAMQYSHVGYFGYEKNTTPNLDAFARDGATGFRDAISPAPWTVPTYLSWFTSLYPSEHQVVNRCSSYNGSYCEIADVRKLRPNTYTLAEILHENGYATAGFTGDAGARGASGDNIGFDVYIDTPSGFNSFNYSEPLAMNWITQHKDKKFFVFLHGYDAHGQDQLGNFTGKFLDYNYTGKYTGSAAEQAQLREEGLAYGYVNISSDNVKFWRAVYDEKINNADARFGDFIQGLDKLGLLNKTMIIIASDHGTEFYEHGRFDHGHTLYQELIHVPLIIKIPSIKGVQVSSTQVSTIDFMPTVLNALGINVNQTVQNQMKGQTLIPAMIGKGIGRDIFSETDYRLYTHKRSVTTTDGWKFILTLAEYPNKTDVKELYNLNTDPKDQNNLINSQPKIAYELEQEVLKHMKDMGTDIEGPWIIGCSPVYSDQCRTTKTEAFMQPYYGD